MRKNVCIISIMVLMGTILFTNCKKEDKSPFGPATEFDLTTPLNYDPNTVIDNFSGKINAYPDVRMTSANFNNAINMLVIGEKYRVKIFPIIQEVSFDDCMTFLKSQKVIFVGAQGLILSLYLRKNEFPRDLMIYSFDEINYLWKDPDGYPNVPGAQIAAHVNRNSHDVTFDFKPDYREDFFWPGQALLCFVKE